MNNSAEKFLAISICFIFLSCSSLSTYGQKKNDQETISPEHVLKIVGSNCATCHQDNGSSRAPAFMHLAAMSPKSIVASLETGKMQIQGSTLSKAEKVAVAEFLTQRKISTKAKILNYCSNLDAIKGDLIYSGWGGNLEGTGFIEESVAQLSKKNIPNLKLKWALGFEGGTITRTKPAVIGKYILFGSQFGEVFCLNGESGCVKWMFEADANVRGGIAVSDEIEKNKIAFFADFGGNTYALNTNNGEIIWKVNVKNDPNNAVTGTVAYYDGMVYVPISSMEVVTGIQPTYECCKSSGQVVALDAKTGEEIWRHRVIEEMATEHGKSAVGTKRFGPSGSPIWSSPSIDKKRGLLYIGTGENNSYPTTLNSDALQALDLKTGSLKWTFQATNRDVYLSDCNQEPNSPNCPEPPGDDVDFGMAPILTTRSDGKDVLVVGQKSGVVHCLDPDTGTIIWQKRIGRGGALGGIHWGMATDGKMVYATNSDWLPLGGDSTFAANPGVFAMNLMTGAISWQSTSDPSICEGRVGCYNSNSASPVLLDGFVLAGSLDGHMRAYDTQNGQVIWDYDTAIPFETVNGVKGHGGSIDGPSAVVANGTVFINSGYGMFGQMPGNVLLAFSVD